MRPSRLGAAVADAAARGTRGWKSIAEVAAEGRGATAVHLRVRRSVDPIRQMRDSR
jgi:hypothetical protein